MSEWEVFFKTSYFSKAVQVLSQRLKKSILQSMLLYWHKEQFFFLKVCTIWMKEVLIVPWWIFFHSRTTKGLICDFISIF